MTKFLLVKLIFANLTRSGVAKKGPHFWSENPEKSFFLYIHNWVMIFSGQFDRIFINKSQFGLYLDIWWSKSRQNGSVLVFGHFTFPSYLVRPSVNFEKVFLNRWQVHKIEILTQLFGLVNLKFKHIWPKLPIYIWIETFQNCNMDSFSLLYFSSDWLNELLEMIQAFGWHFQKHYTPTSVALLKTIKTF